MRRKRPERWSWAFGLALLLASADAAAASSNGVEPIRIEYHAPPRCPSEAVFLAQVRARTSKARPASPGERARTFSVTVTQEGQRTLGKLKIEDPPGPPAVREVSGEECSEIVSALSLIMALAVDPHASTAPDKSLPPPPHASDPSNGVEEPPAPTGAGQHLPLPFRAPPPAPYVPPPTWLGPVAMPLPALLTPPPPAALSPWWRFSFGLQIAAESAVAPGLNLGVAGFIDAERRAASILAPALRFSVFWVDSGETRSGTVFSQFHWIAGRLEGCPIGYKPIAELRLSPCALLDIGVLDAEGGGRRSTGSSVRPWVAPGLSGRIQAEITGPLRLEAEAGATFPLVRDTFYVALMKDVHRAAAVGASLAAGVSFHSF